MLDPDLTSPHVPCDRSGSGADAPDRVPGARLPLSRERIVDAAVRYVDHDCLARLSMRRLGAELGVEAMSLYRYFPSKAALLDAVVCRLLSDLALPGADGGGPWEDAVRGYARSFRSIAAAHPHLVPLLATIGPASPTLATVERRMTGVWRDAGFEPAVAADAQSAMQGYLMGSCLRDTRDARFARDAREDGAFALGLDALIAGLRVRLAEARSRRA
jgi:AcrR family transcriptional regulator